MSEEEKAYHGYAMGQYLFVAAGFLSIGIAIGNNLGAVLIIAAFIIAVTALKHIDSPLQSLPIGERKPSVIRHKFPSGLSFAALGVAIVGGVAAYLYGIGIVKSVQWGAGILTILNSFLIWHYRRGLKPYFTQ